MSLYCLCLHDKHYIPLPRQETETSNSTSYTNCSERCSQKKPNNSPRKRQFCLDGLLSCRVKEQNTLVVLSGYGFKESLKRTGGPQKDINRSSIEGYVSQSALTPYGTLEPRLATNVAGNQLLHLVNQL